WSLGKWDFRQFIYLINTSGLNRDPNDYINLNGRNSESLYGFNSNKVMGTFKTLLKIESIVYTPFNFAGIQLATVLFAGAGKVSSNPFHPAINDNTIYQAYGMGFLIRKENLVVNTIRISLGYYPNIPTGTGMNYRFNPFSINN